MIGRVVIAEDAILDSLLQIQDAENVSTIFFAHNISAFRIHWNRTKLKEFVRFLSQNIAYSILTEHWVSLFIGKFPQSAQ